MADIAVQIDGHTHVLRSGETAVVGRDPDADLVVHNRTVSRFHLKISCVGGEWIAQDLQTSNGTHLNGQRLPDPAEVILQPGAELMVGDPVIGAEMRVVRIGAESVGPETHNIGLVTTGMGLAPLRKVSTFVPVASGEPLTIGRSKDNSLPIDDPVISQHHARVSDEGDGCFLVEDLHSTNGSYIGGEPVTRARAYPGDIISFGSVFFEVTDTGLHHLETLPVDPCDGERISLSVSDLSYWVDSGDSARGGRATKRLLDAVSFSVPECSLVAVIGPSGAGKTTIMKAITGAIRPDRGQVLFNGMDMAVFSTALADKIGMVPQEDVVHRELTARQALHYAALLRFPDDSLASERDAAVEWAIEELGLGPHADTRVHRLSGGQRKRVNTAMELLTQPDLLMLDEPTSGLDPNLDREIMELLRDLAHGAGGQSSGRTVVVTTHSTDNLDKADLVLLIAPGGKVAYFGSSNRILGYFGRLLGDEATWADIYSFISEHPDQAQESFARSPLAGGTVEPNVQPGRYPGARPRPKRLIRQAGILLSRQVRLMTKDRSLVVFTLALPVVVGLLSLAVRATNGFDPALTTKSTGQPRVLLVIMIFGAVLMGMVPAVRQLVSERPIFLRESAVGVRPAAYLAGKVLLLGAVCAVQSAILTTVVLLVNRHPAFGVYTILWLELYVMVFIVAWASASLGLLMSSLVTNSDQVMPLMVLVLMFQLVMSGGVFNVNVIGINQLSYASISRWGFSVGASSLDFNTTVTCQTQILTKQIEDDQVNQETRRATDQANQDALEQARAHGLPDPELKQAEIRHTIVDCGKVDDQDRLWTGTPAIWWGDLSMIMLWFFTYLVATWYVLVRTVRE